MSTHIEPGFYQLRLKWLTKNDEVEVGYTNASARDWQELKDEIENAKRYLAYNAKDKKNIEATFKLIQLNDVTRSYEDDDDYLGLNKPEDLSFILDI